MNIFKSKFGLLTAFLCLTFTVQAQVSNPSNSTDISHAIFQEMSIFNSRIPLQVGMQAIALAAHVIGCGLSSTGGLLLVPDGTSCTLSPFARRAFAWIALG